MNANREILDYIRDNYKIYQRHAIDANLEKAGFTTAQINEAWKILEQESKSQVTPSMAGRPNSLTQGAFWLTLLLVIPGVPFISGLLGGIIGTGLTLLIGILLLLTTFFTGLVLTVRNREIRERAVGLALLVGPMLTLVFLFIPPFILYGICVAGSDLVHHG